MYSVTQISATYSSLVGCQATMLNYRTLVCTVIVGHTFQCAFTHIPMQNSTMLMFSTSLNSLFCYMLNFNIANIVIHTFIWTRQVVISRHVTPQNHLNQRSNAVNYCFKYVRAIKICMKTDTTVYKLYL